MRIFFESFYHEPPQSTILSVPADTVVKDHNAEGPLKPRR